MCLIRSVYERRLSGENLVIFYSSESTHMLLLEIFFFFRVFLNSQICCSERASLALAKLWEACALPISCYTSVASHSECHQKSFNKWRLWQQGIIFNVIWNYCLIIERYMNECNPLQRFYQAQESFHVFNKSRAIHKEKSRPVTFCASSFFEYHLVLGDIRFELFSPSGCRLCETDQPWWNIHGFPL